MNFILVIACFIILYLTFSFAQYLVECELTKDWNQGNWAIFREYKDIVGKPNLTVAEYCNIRAKQQDEKIEELFSLRRTKYPYKKNNIRIIRE